MSSSAAQLNYSNYKNCFANLSLRQDGTTHLEENTILKVIWKDYYLFTVHKTHQLSHAHGVESISLNGLLAEKNGFPHGENVLIQVTSNVKICRSVQVEPFSVDDWEILEIHASFIEEHLLDQVSIVWPGAVLPIWVKGNVCIFTKITNLNPSNECCRLAQNTELIVSSKVRTFNSSTDVAEKNINSQVTPNKDFKSYSEDEISDVHNTKFNNILDVAEKNINSLITPNEDLKSYSEDDKIPDVHNTKFNNILDVAEKNINSQITPNKDLKSYSEDDEISDVHNTEFNNISDIIERNSNKSGTIFSNSILDFVNPYIVTSIENAVKSVWRWWMSPNGKAISKTHQDDYHQNFENVSFCEVAFKAHLRAIPLNDSLMRVSINNIDDKDIEKINILKPKQQPYNVYISYTTYLSALKHTADSNSMNTHYFLATIQKVASPYAQKSLRKGISSTLKHESSLINLKDSNCTKTTVRVIVIGQDSECCCKIYMPDDCIMVHDCLRQQMELSINDSILIQSLKHLQPRNYSGICIIPLKSCTLPNSNELIKDSLKVWLDTTTSYCNPAILNDRSVVPLQLEDNDTYNVFISFEARETERDPTENDNYYFLYNEMITKTEVNVMSLNSSSIPRYIDTKLKTLQEIDKDSSSAIFKHIGYLQKIVTDLKSFILKNTSFTPLSKCQLKSNHHFSILSALICGKAGIGKTALCSVLLDNLKKAPFHYHVETVDCKHLKGKRPDFLNQMISKAILKLKWRGYGVLLLENIDKLVSNLHGPEMEGGPLFIYNTKILNFLKHIIVREQKCNSKIFFLATCHSKSEINDALNFWRPHRIFQKIFEVSIPDHLERIDIIRNILSYKRKVHHVSLDNLDFTAIAKSTENYVARDLEILVDRAIHFNWISNLDEFSKDTLLANQDFVIALKDYVPAALRNVKLHKEKEVDLRDIGGLSAAKNELIETLMWPAKYPELFSKCPIKLSSGILLYGAPGTGKTLLARAVAKESHMNFISIKGPELLSKYIGSSEENVRDIFLQAQSAKPCILFFDEFDSLAPCRGHDSTGVTDRVVNQLLTQLDGVEQLDDVYILAATNRPDLIDSALLRPGRLDLAIYCSVPDQNSRLEILMSLSRCMNFSYDIDLIEISARCKNYTGADLKALLYNAHCLAIHESFSSNRDISKDLSFFKNNDNSETADFLDSFADDVMYINKLENGVENITLTKKYEIMESLRNTNFTNRFKNRPIVPQKTSNEEEKGSEIIISMKNITKAIESVRPSLSQKDCKFYESIYANFKSKQSFEHDSQQIGKRTTLA